MEVNNKGANAVSVEMLQGCNIKEAGKKTRNGRGERYYLLTSSKQTHPRKQFNNC